MSVTDKLIIDQAPDSAEIKDLTPLLYPEQNPAFTDKVVISWKTGDESANMTAYKNDSESPAGSLPFVIQEDRLYLPMRAVCETLGETVEWDDATKTACVVRDNAIIKMSGIVVNDRTMVKIRDFEKLGYSVDYTEFSVDGTGVYQKTATISKG